MSDAPKVGDVLVMVGTKKGSFLFWSDPARMQWQRSQHHRGWMVHHLAHDPRDNSIYAATNSGNYDGVVQRTPDFGATWERRSEKLDFPAESEHRVRKVWHLAPKPNGSPGHLYAGVERAGLFTTDDFGATWNGVDGLNNHEHSPDWQPGGGGLMVHTILVDPREPNRIYVAISAAGTYRSDDGGMTWTAKNKNVRADWAPLASGLPDTAYLTVLREAMALDSADRCGVYVGTETGQLFFSPNGGDRWELMADLLPPIYSVSTGRVA